MSVVRMIVHSNIHDSLIEAPNTSMATAIPVTNAICAARNGSRFGVSDGMIQNRAWAPVIAVVTIGSI